MWHHQRTPFAAYRTHKHLIGKREREKCFTITISFFSWYIQNAYHPRIESYEPVNSSGIDCISNTVNTTQLTLQETWIVSRRRRLSISMRICEQRKARRRKLSLLSASHGPLRFRHQSLVCHSRFAFALCEERSAWWGGKRNVASIKSISFDDVTTKQELILRKACCRRSDSRARAENLTRTPLPERLQQAILRSARTDQKQPPKFGTV